MNDRDFARLLERIHRVGDCWLVGDGPGYAYFYLDGKSQRAHIVAYEHYVGPVPVGRRLDHTCHRKRCINPRHLEPVTHQENCRRASVQRTRAREKRERNRAARAWYR